MHEMGIALEIIKIATESIPAEHADARVERVYLEVGKLAAVVPDSLSFCFGIASENTRLHGAELVIEEIPVVAKCRDCSHQWTIERAAFSCLACNSGNIELLSGRELDIRSIEIIGEDMGHGND